MHPSDEIQTLKQGRVAIPLSGISAQDARNRLEQYGPNNLKDETVKSLLNIIFEALREPMVMLLIGIGAVYLSLGEIEEVVSLLSFLLLILVLTVYQEKKTQTKLSALRELSSPRATVKRDGEKIRIPGKEIVPGDLVLLSEGGRIPADIELLDGGPLTLDESILTGESYSVIKSPSKESPTRVFSGTMVTKGQAWGEVIATGYQTEIGKIGKSLQTDGPQPTALQKMTTSAVRKVSLIVAFLMTLVIGFYWLNGHGWLDSFLVGLTLAMAILPNELPAVFLIFIAAGTWRISKRQVLTRRVPAIEALGSITVLCVDKTGTLTQNKMIVQTLWTGQEEIDFAREQVQVLPEPFHEVLEFGILASAPHPFDPMEKAFHHIGHNYLEHTEHLHPEWILSKEYQITDELLAVSYAWHPPDKNGFDIGAKGATEAIIDLCHLPPEKTERINEQMKTMARRGLRIIAVAKAKSQKLPAIQHDLDFEFVGLVGFADPLRSDANAAIDECRRAGIRVMMITGDHPLTGKSIAEQAGLGTNQEVLTGAEINSLDDKTLSEVLKHTQIFCRMNPIQKHRVVALLQKNGEIVAMTGDGVNDAPALKKADVGIAMGQRGTDVAREAADIVLLDDNFSSIVAAIRIGRRTYRNLQDAFSYLLGIHTPIAIMSIVPVMFDLPLILLPVHIAFLHLIIEPACTVVYEARAGRTTLMRDPPRKIDAPILSRTEIFKSFAQGMWISMIVTVALVFTLWRNSPPGDTRAITFTSLILANLALIWSDQKQKFTAQENRPFLIIVVVTFLLLATALYVPFFRHLFQFEPLHLSDLWFCLSMAALSAGGLKLITALWPRTQPRK